MEKQTITFADQEIANRFKCIAPLSKDVEKRQLRKGSTRYSTKWKIRRMSVAGRDAFSADNVSDHVDPILVQAI
ncbi:hypothetical protein MASR1M36_07790 [Candidatus Cloacimonadaceae bacterium]